ncbi:hypothetical protein HGRIS_000926 [Hohenbuehelia grisea]|uniref:Uncharacterized protein n=1 Tax=Hohenbuehelia grisea TaxID=104357 RepID=A0ABR3IQ80_9AGAR
MAFASAQDFQVDHSTFNDVGGDQHTAYLFNVSGDVIVQGTSLSHPSPTQLASASTRHPSYSAQSLSAQNPTSLPLTVPWETINSASAFDSAKAVIITISMVIGAVDNQSPAWADFVSSLDLLKRTLRLVNMVATLLERMPSGEATLRSVMLKVTDCAETVAPARRYLSISK